MRDESSNDTGPMSDDGTTCGPFHRPKETGGSISSAADSPVRTLAMPEDGSESTVNGRGCGRSSRGSLASYDPVTSSWRTSQLCLDGERDEFSATFPRSGTMRNGRLFRRAPLVPRTSGKDSGFWPTPTKADGERGSLMYQGNHNPTLLGAVRMFWPTPKGSAEHYGQPRENDRGDLQAAVMTMYPTPSARDWRSGLASDATHERNSRPLNEVIVRESFPTPTANRWDGLQSHGVNVVSGQLNPTWVEWLMGFPLGWTVCDASATPSSRRSSNGSDNESSKAR